MLVLADFRLRMFGGAAASALRLHLGALLAEDGFARKANAIAFDGEHLDQDLVAFFEFVANVLDAMFGDFADVQQAIGAGEDLDEGAEIGQAHHFAEIRFADLGGGGEVADHLQRLGCRFFVIRGDIDAAGIFDVDLDAGGLNDAANYLATGPNHVADLIDRDLQGVDARREGGNLGARLGDGFVHLVEDEQAAAAGLLQGFTHDLRGDARDLDIHLQGGDAVAGAGDFEIHVAVVVFGAGDIGEDGVLLFFLDQAHGHAGHGGAQRNAGIHHGKRGAADAGHGGGAVGFENVADHAHGVRPVFFTGQNRADGALGEGAVADFAAAGAAQEGDFAHRERR